MSRFVVRRAHSLRTTVSPLSLSVLSAFMLLVSVTASGAEPEAGEAMQSLDQQVQDIKSDVLAIAAELRVLEEQLLHPSDSQVAVFVSLGGGAEAEDVVLDSVSVSIDGEVVAEHVYSFKEIEALQKGGVQRIHTGNLRTGEHSLEVHLRGQRVGGGEFDVTERSVLSKGVGPKKVGVTVDSSMISTASVRIEAW
jgi:archaellum component FlaG (FlaF/FlaG flagellin family)